MAKILLIEDDEQLSDIVRTALLFEHHTVDAVVNGAEGYGFLCMNPYDLVVLDWGLPEMNGIDICRGYRAKGGIAPILMLTGKGNISEKESGFDAGADDYLTKPFHMKELLARVRALLRRPASLVETVLKAGNLSLDPKKHRAFLNGESLSLVPKEFSLLEFFMRHPGQVFTPESLLEHVWPTDSDSTSLAVRTTMKRLRKKIDPDGKLLKTEHGIGYMLVVPDT